MLNRLQTMLEDIRSQVERIFIVGTDHEETLSRIEYLVVGVFKVPFILFRTLLPTETLCLLYSTFAHFALGDIEPKGNATHCRVRVWAEGNFSNKDMG